MGTSATLAWVVACGASGALFGVAVYAVRRRREVTALERETASLYRRLQASEGALSGLREQVSELAPALIDGQRRWGFDLGHWPDVWELVGEPSPSAVCWWLLQHAPGIARLSDGQRATARFFSGFDGWRPPRIPAGR